MLNDNLEEKYEELFKEIISLLPKEKKSLIVELDSITEMLHSNEKIKKWRINGKILNKRISVF